MKIPDKFLKFLQEMNPIEKLCWMKLSEKDKTEILKRCKEIQVNKK